MNAMPTYWRTLPLKDFVISRKGKKPLKLASSFFEESVPYLDIDAIENGNIKQYADSVTTLISNENDVFIVADGSRSGLVKRGMSGAVGSTILCLTPLAIKTEYLYYYLQSKFEYLNRNTTGASVPHLNQNLLLHIEVPIPPIEEQNAIANLLSEKLDHYQTDFNNAKHELAKVKKYKQSVLEKAFSGELTEQWRKVHKSSISETQSQLFKLNSTAHIFENSSFRSNIPKNWLITNAKSICSKITDGEHQTPKRQKNGKLLLTAKNIRDGYIEYENVEYISNDDFEKSLKRCNPTPGDVLVVSVGATIGRASVIRKKIKFALVRSVLLFKPLIDGEYLMFCFQSPILQDIISESSKGVAQQSLYIGEANNLPIPFPPIAEQKEIVYQVSLHFQTASLIEQSTSNALKKITDLQHAIFQLAYSGQLTKGLCAPTDEGWFDTILQNIRLAKILAKENSLSGLKKKREESKELRISVSMKKSIVEIIEHSPLKKITVEDAWHQSFHFDKGEIEKFYEELELVGKKNKSGKIVEWEFLENKNGVILKFK